MQYITHTFDIEKINTDLLLMINKFNIKSLCIYIKNNINSEKIELLRNFSQQNYLLSHCDLKNNLSSSDENIRLYSTQNLIKEILIFESLNIKYVVLHPGTSKGLLTKEQTIQNLLQSLKTICLNTKAILVIENMPDVNFLLRSIEEIQYFFDKVNQDIILKDRIKLCLDTCHLFTVGYNLNDKNTVLYLSEKIKNLPLQIVHVNDSKKSFLSTLDFHENIGQGYLRKFFTNNYLPLLFKYFLDQKIFYILETPSKHIEQNILNDVIITEIKLIENEFQNFETESKKKRC